MRLFKATYKDRNGKTRQTGKWYIDFTDHAQIRRRMPAFTDKKACEALGRHIEQLVCCKAAKEPLDRELTETIAQLPQSMKDFLLKIGLMDAQKNQAGRPLLQHLSDFKASLKAKGNTEQHIKLVESRAKKVITDCGFMNWTDISASMVYRYLDKLRDNGNGIAAQTFNFYLQAFKQFCKWMVEDRRASESPVKHLKPLNVKTDRRHDRRALEPNEIRLLLETTRNAPKRYGMTGRERAMLYRLAVETGLRRKELGSLKVSSFDFQNNSVTVMAGYSKRRREDMLPLKPETAAEFQLFLQGKLPNAKVFRIGKHHRTSDMIKADLEDAGIAYVDESGRYADFHATRHTTGSLLAATGANPKVAQSIMRHSDINLTLSRYSHLFKGQESEAIARMPDLSAPSSQQQARTGTNDADPMPKGEKDVFAICLAKQGGFEGISMDFDGQIKGEEGKNTPPHKDALVLENKGFQAPKGVDRREGDSNPRYRRLPVRRFSKPLP